MSGHIYTHTYEVSVLYLWELEMAM